MEAPYGTLVQREEHSLGMREVEISKFSRTSIRLGVKICDYGKSRLPESILVSEGTAELLKYVSTLATAARGVVGSYGLNHLGYWC